jgi:hypothetical protein
MQEPPEDDKRKARRQRVFKGGKILFNDGNSTIDCTIRNLSDTGAKLEVESVIGVPAEFMLVSHDGTERWSRVMWRAGTSLGVSFKQQD